MITVRRICILLFIICLAPAMLMADTITLRTGSKIFGRIVGQTRTTVRVRLDNGRTQTISKKRIRRISYGRTPAQRAAEKREKLRIEAARRRREAARRRAAEAAEAARKRAEEDRKAALARKAAEDERQRKAEAERKRLAEEKRIADERKQRRAAGGLPTRNDMLWRSAVLPGWGHYHNDQKMLSYGYGGAFLGALALTVAGASAVGSAKSAYDSETQNSTFIGILAAQSSSSSTDLTPFVLPNILDSSARSTYENSLSNYRAALGIMGLVYAAQLVHVYFFSDAASPGRLKTLKDADQESGPRLAIDFAPPARFLPGARSGEPARDDGLSISLQFRF